MWAALELEGGGYAPMLTAQFVCMKDDLSEAMALVEEILTKTSLEDTDQMLMNATQAAFMPGYIAQNQPTQLANILLPAMTTKAGKYNYFVSFCRPILRRACWRWTRTAGSGQAGQ